MADEITIQFRVQEGADALRARWRAEPPDWIRRYDYKPVDESYDSLVYERDHSKMTKILTWGFAKTTYRLTLTFRQDDAFGASVTVSGKMPEDGQAEVKAFADQHGGWKDPRVR